MKNGEYMLEMKDIVKTFPGVKALKKVNLSVKKGEIHALLGENGAGKSTLMKCLIGMQPPTSGEIYLEGKKIENYNTEQALNMGISMIHQELSPVLHRSVMENIWLNREPVNKFGLINHKEMYKITEDLLQIVELDINPKTLMKDLTVAKIQMIEIAKAVSYDSKVIIMDEPTSALTDKEVENLYKIMSRLKEKGVSIIYISHKLDEIYAIADRATIFRDGEYIGSEDVKNLPIQKMINMMVGRDVENMYPQRIDKIGDIKLEVKDFSRMREFNDISFQVRAGEILGIAGLVGAGRTELIETIFGIHKKESGEVYLNNKLVNIKTPGDAIDNGLALLTEDRKESGIYPMLSVKFNTTISNLDKYINKVGIIDNKEMGKDCSDYIKAIKIKTPSDATSIENLSGGNQQKVLIARWLLTNPEVLFLDEPTRGIDIGAKAEIYKIISELAASGKAIVMVSSELPEILGMSHRVMVMHEGKVTGILDNNHDLSQETIMQYATNQIENEGVN